MTAIIKADENQALLLSGIAKRSFVESHGNSAGSADINSYVTEKYSEDVLRQELRDPENCYYIIYHNDLVAGYSKIIMNAPYAGSEIANIAKLERFYLLKDFYSFGLGSELLKFNIRLTQNNKQAGVWLFVWKENQRAVRFYTKNGFVIIGSYDFKIAEHHYNPNHQMFLSLNDL